jgi:hypothetical protein
MDSLLDSVSCFHSSAKRRENVERHWTRYPRQKAGFEILEFAWSSQMNELEEKPR